MGALAQDLRFAIRILAKSPGFTAAAVLSLGLGIGANTTVFSIVNGLLLRPLPVREPERIVAVYTSDYSGPLYGGSSYPDYRDFLEKTDAFAGLSAFTLAPMSLVGGGRNERVFGELVTSNFFEVAGTRPGLGRLLQPEEDGAAGSPPVLVLSDGLWRRSFGSDPGILGKAVTLNGRPFQVVGVAPPGFTGVLRGPAPDLWAPLTAPGAISSGDRLDSRGNRWLFVFGRLKPGVSGGAAQAQLTTLAKQLQQAFPANWTDLRQRTRTITVVPESLARLYPEVRGAFLGFSGLLMATVGLVLLIACTNVANLLLARAAARRQETSVRLTLGASRGRLVRQLLTESLLLALLAGGVGTLLALWATDLLMAWHLPLPVPLAVSIGLDARVLAFTLVLCTLTGVAFGLVPALQASRRELLPALKGELGPHVASSRWFSARNLLVVGQTALSLVLLVGSGLFLRSLRHAQSIDPGFDPKNLVLLSLDPRLNGYGEAQGQQVFQQLLERIAAAPGVQAASLTSTPPLGLESRRRRVTIEGYTPRDGEDMEVVTSSIGPGYFRTMGIPLAAGRDFSDTDRLGAPAVAIVNEAFARRYWPGQQALGKHLHQGRMDTPLEIVGVARDGKYRTLGEDPTPFYFIPFLQTGESEATLLVRSSRGLGATMAAVRAQVQGLDPNLPVYDVKTMAEHMRLALLPARVAGGVLGGFGAVALLLTVLGLYGVMSHAVSQRTRELGVRTVLGARPADLLTMVLTQGLILAGIGTGIGLALAWVVSRLVASLLYGISATDPLTFAGVPALLVGTALVASYLPARRATKVDPMVALHCE
jgi:predicted permease